MYMRFYTPIPVNGLDRPSVCFGRYTLGSHQGYKFLRVFDPLDADTLAFREQDGKVVCWTLNLHQKLTETCRLGPSLEEWSSSQHWAPARQGVPAKLLKGME